MTQAAECRQGRCVECMCTYQMRLLQANSKLLN